MLGGDFRKILPIIIQGTRQDTISATINRSYLWNKCKVHTLEKKYTPKQDELEFSRWISEVGDGNARTVGLVATDFNDDDAIEIEKEPIPPTRGDPLENIFKTIYKDFDSRSEDKEYQRGRAILTPHNEIVDEVNEFILSQLEGDIIEYLSSDTNIEEANLLYTVEYLNSFKCSGLQNHQLKLKNKMPIILMRNINQKEGLCNGTRMLVTKLGKKVVEIEIWTGGNVGEKMRIPRIIMTTADNKCPYKMRRRQFPIHVCYAMTINKSP